MSLAENTHGIARIIATGPDGIGEKHTGMAIVIDVRHVMTCCHVLNDALARTNRLDSASPPEDELFDIRFPYAANAKRAGKVVQWGRALQSAKDVAVIELTEDAPSEAGVAVFSEAEARTMGWCCVGADNASIYREPEGRLGSVLPDGTRQLNGPTGVGARIAPGYSGAPVWSDDVKAFVGMVVTKDRDQFVENGLAYAIPTCELIDVWRWLEVARQSPPALGPGGEQADFDELIARLADPREYEREKQRIYIHLGELGTHEAELALRNALTARLSPLEREGVARGLELIAARKRGKGAPRYNLTVSRKPYG